MREIFEDDGDRQGVSGAVPDIYADAVEIYTGLYGVTLNFGLNQPRGAGRPPFIRPQGYVHISPQLAKVFGLLLRKTVRQYEAEIGPVAIPEQLLREWGLDQEPA